MAVTQSPPEQIGATSWRFSWASDLESPTFYVYVDGVLSQVTDATEMILAVEAGASVFVEVFDGSGDTPSVVYSGYARLCWYPATDMDAAEYVIELRSGGGDWEEVDRVISDGRGFYSWRSGWLDDETLYVWRVRALHASGNYGTAVVLPWLSVRYPDTPAVEYAWSDETGALTISAA